MTTNLEDYAACLEKAAAWLDDGKWLRTAEWSEGEREILRRYMPLTMKRVLYVCNVAEDDLAGDSQLVAKVREHAASQGSEVVVLCAQTSTASAQCAR